MSPHEVPESDDWLGPDEKEAAVRFRLPKRRSEWRTGRWAAKTLAAAQYGILPERWSRLQILAAVDGAPELWLDGQREPVPISLSHRDGVAVAASSPRADRLGVDLERIEPRSQRFMQDFFTSEELHACRSAAEPDRELLPVLIWSAKESALKALRTGLRRDTRSIEVNVPALPRTGWVRLEVFDRTERSPFESYAALRTGHVVTLAF